MHACIQYIIKSELALSWYLVHTSQPN